MTLGSKVKFKYILFKKCFKAHNADVPCIFDGGVHIWNINCLCYVDNNKGFGLPMHV